MAKHLADCTVLSNNVRMPWIGLGVWKSKEGQEVERAVAAALKAGYRSIDTAAIYGNETGVGKAIQQAGIERNELFVTTKVWNADQGYESTLAAFEESRKKLGLDYIDLYLIHWPVKGKYKDTWRALEKLYKDGLVRAIGVSNFQPHHLEDLMADSEVTPMLNQIELHPLLSQKDVRAFCKQHGIQVEAWSPLGQGGELLQHPVLTEIARKHDKTAAQVILRWDLQHEVVTIPKSVHEARIVENAELFDFVLSAEEMEKIDGLNEDKRIGPDPDNFDF